MYIPCANSKYQCTACDYRHIILTVSTLHSKCLSEDVTQTNRIPYLVM